MLMNILFIADVNKKSHDLKWIKVISSIEDGSCYQLCIDHQYNRIEPSVRQNLKSWGVELLGGIPYFSSKRFLTTWKTAARIKKIIRAKNIDILHIHYAEPHSLWGIYRRYFGIPVVVTTRGTDILGEISQLFNRSDLFSKYLQKQYKKAFQNIDLFTSTSIQQKNKVEEVGGQKCKIVRTGVDVEEVLNSTTFDDIPEGKFILFPRTMSPLYNHEFSLEAISLLPEDIRSAYTFVFLDADGRDVGYVKKIKDQMASIPANFNFFPSLAATDLYALYKKASITVMNPKSDGTPVSALEAMICECPVILGSLNYDALIFKEKATILPNWEPQSLASAIQNRINDPVCQEKLEQIKAETIDLASRDAEMKMLLDLFKTLV